MQISLLQENLHSALTAVSRFVTSKAQLPILNNILFQTDQGRLKLSATNLELGINYWLGAKIETEGSFTIPAKELAEFISYLSPGKLDFDLNENHLLSITSLKAKSTFACTPTTDFPVLPSLNQSQSIVLNYQHLVESVNQVAFAAATDDTRPVLTAVLCRFSPESISFVATDGFRLSIKEITLDKPLVLPNNESLTLLIPSRTLQEITKLSKNTSSISFGSSTDQNQLVFVLEDLELVSRLIDGDFPDYQRIVPQQFATKITFNKDELSQAIKVASVFARESANVVKMSIKSSQIILSANAPQIGENQVTLDAKIEGEPLDIAFNYKFIADYLAVVKSDQIILQLNESLTPGLFTDPLDATFRHIIMPVRVQD
ncbi:MAG TPA: DNA polymerase III subunit beta [Candidatus Woesebacteria bacterium]|nr:DNA polymerase III subunit beta [Candidatus Woesebacteria bacterium]